MTTFNPIIPPSKVIDPQLERYLFHYLRGDIDLAVTISNYLSESCRSTMRIIATMKSAVATLLTGDTLLMYILVNRIQFLLETAHVSFRSRNLVYYAVIHDVIIPHDVCYTETVNTVTWPGLITVDNHPFYLHKRYTNNAKRADSNY